MLSFVLADNVPEVEMVNDPALTVVGPV